MKAKTAAARAKRPARNDTPALRSLRRAAKAAVALAHMTGTPAYVMENGEIIDIAKPHSSRRPRGKR
jgi:hypothetical protein